MTYRYCFFGVILTTVLYSMWSCSVSQHDLVRGEELAGRYCSTCHLNPSPEDLDLATWRDIVLPRMGYFMGIYDEKAERDSLFETGAGMTPVVQANVFPREQTISDADWEEIRNYILSSAPKELGNDVTSRDSIELAELRPRYPKFYMSPPSTTYLDINENRILIGDANQKALFETDLNFKPLRKVTIDNEGIVHVREDDFATLWITTMGSFAPTDAPAGKVTKLGPATMGRQMDIISDLQRPVHTTYGDLDSDGVEELIISEYGKWTGALSLWTIQDGVYSRRNLIQRPGAIGSRMTDWDADGDQDIIALFGQGDEGVMLFRNDGEMQFEAEWLLRMRPSNGSSSFDLIDLDDDGDLDLLYTAGDNADYVSPVKPYHGVYIYENQNQKLVEQQFFPLPGAYKAIPIDRGGRPSLLAISFFPDYGSERPTVAAIIDIESGQQTRLPIVDQGRWIVADCNDDQRCILGSLTMEAPQRPELVQGWMQSGLAVMGVEL
ncbi:MAG: FG-GAP-like repeat-containing protein [Bacteroidota bacterium]